MSERKLPSEVVVQLHGGEVIHELSPLEELVSKWLENTYRGSQILDLPPQRWNVPGWLPSDSVTAVYAMPGVGKSFYALSLAIECARGGEWVGTKLEPVPVLYVAAERLTTLRDRAEAWTVRSEELLPSNLLLPKFSHTPQLTNPADVQALCSYIQAERVRFVVLDTYAMMTQGIDENSSQYTGVIMEGLSQIRQATNGGAVMVVHHSRKDSNSTLRGSGAFLAAVDLSIEIAPSGTSGISATVRKSNAAVKPMKEYYELETVPLSAIDGEYRSSAVLVPTGAPRKDEALEGMVIEILEGCTSGSLSKKQILQALEEMGHGRSESTIEKKVLKPLVERKVIEVLGKGVSTRYGLAMS